jgi:hypothetical protein
MTWRLFVGASIISAGVLLKVGAPVVSVAVGIALAAWLNHLRLSARGSRGRSGS